MPSYSLDFPYVLGRPGQTAVFRRSPQDFIVEEIMSEPLSGEGEHFWLHIRKCGENTDWVAKKLANYFSVRKMDVGYGGKKDRHAETSQWFSVYLPGKEHKIDWPEFIDMAKIDAHLLECKSHHRKLKLGQHESNRFCITLHDVDHDDTLVKRLEKIAEFGVPNYFGLQRFGREGANLQKVDKWVADPRSVRDRSLRGILISSARSYLFNQVLANRVSAESWLDILPGEPQESMPTGPLWGRGLSLAHADCLALESSVLEPFGAWALALENVGLMQERRALQLKPSHFSYQFQSDHLVVRFTLNPGEYATAVLREIALLDETHRHMKG